MPETKTAKQIMSQRLVTFRPDMDILEAVRVLIDKRISGAPVLDQLGNLVGMLTERDCLKVALDASYYRESGGKVESFMTPAVINVSADTPAVEIAERFATSHLRRLPVLENGRLIGIVSRRDVLRQLESGWELDASRA
ncbi:CBS domain-containing protein [Thiorhodovibrio frisius]|uniref:CBS-domain-containing membrane protein n=1 Tax=Thiorhodovibrio frisius TaxID=631362 RepID=H8Z133_9GAMM|nr:CBS domain-containing protein [Thiorhodovibrio frisius]EIC22454.1 CBS-domain-containing membrane protein [Thiorhodovibrio frisius]WPL24755.1 Inosine-5'-monophosphate dehydrogenase [Thiorhodovibrio frisius]